MNNKFLIIISYILISFQVFAVKPSMKNSNRSTELLIRAVRAKLIKEKIDPETESLIKRLKSVVPFLEKKLSKQPKKKGRVSETQSLLWQVNAELQAFEVIKSDLKDPSRALVRKQLLWNKLLNLLFELEKEANNNILSLRLIEGRSILSELMDDLSDLTLSRNERDGIAYIADLMERWDDDAKNKQKTLDMDSSEISPPTLERNNAIIALPKRPSSLERGYLPSK